MLFKSPHAAMTFNIRSEAKRFHPITGVELGRIPAIRAEFGQLGDEMTITDPETGDQITVANISGHFFDTDEAAERLKWTPDEKETVEIVLMNKCSEVPMFIQLVERTRVVAQAPWLNYEQLDVALVAKMAESLGLVPEALLYERQNAARPEALEALEALFAELSKDDQGRGSEREVYATEDLVVNRAGPDRPVHIGRPPRRTDGGITTY